MSMNTRMYKDKQSGWNARTVIKLPENRELDIGTSKSLNGELVTRATVATVNKDGSRTTRVSFGAPGGDYFETVIRSRLSRITESVVRLQHEQALKLEPQILASVKTFYGLTDSTKVEQSAEVEESVGA